MSKKIVLVLCGGVSSEREVSLMSGHNVYVAIDRRKYTPLLVEITKFGHWYHIQAARRKKISNLGEFLKTIDVVFIALHGRDGEDGRIQKFLGKYGVDYTGSGDSASKLAFNKDKTAKVVHGNGILTPITKIATRSKPLLFKDVVTILGLPFIVKPNESGSSVATAIVKTEREYKKILSSALAEDENVLAQEYIKGREFTCSVLGYQENIRALPIVEIIPKSEFFDYKAKYVSSKTQEIVPAKIDNTLERKIKSQSKIIHEAIGCRGLTRSDFILSTDNKVYFLEINTIPGMTNASLSPKSAKAAGMTLTQLVSSIIDIGGII